MVIYHKTRNVVVYLYPGWLECSRVSGFSITPQAGEPVGVPLNLIVYARHGRDLMGWKSPVCKPDYYQAIVVKILVEGKGDLVRDGLKEAGVQSYESTNRNGIQGPVSG